MMKSDIPERVPKLCGGDLELGNFMTGLDGTGCTGATASRALLAEFDGFGDRSFHAPAVSPLAPAGLQPSGVRECDNNGAAWAGWSSRDWGRKFLPANGGCAYIDLDHLELCLPEVRSAADHVACWHAMLRLAQRAMHSANRRLPAGQRIHVHANNSDGQSQSYGGHLNVLISRAAWECIFHEKLHYLLYLASFLVSSMVYGGQGKVGSENGRPPVSFQLSQRADFLETVMGVQTTYRRPIVNARDEPLVGRALTAAEDPGQRLARLHVISLDTTLCHVAGLLKVGTLQIVLGMIEAGEKFCQDLMLDDPVGAVVRWSHDPTLGHHELTVTGRGVTVVEHQQMYLEAAVACADRVGLGDYVPGVAQILELWDDTLVKLKARDHETLARRLDWVLKRAFLERALEHRPDLSWTSPQLKHLDHLFSSLDPSTGLYLQAERDGLVDRVVSADQIDRFTRQPPTNTRAWTRSMVLRAAGDRVEYVDWDEVRIRDTRGPWFETSTIRLPDPLGYTREWFDRLLAQSGHADAAIDWMSEPARRTSYH